MKKRYFPTYDEIFNYSSEYITTCNNRNEGNPDIYNLCFELNLRNLTQREFLNLQMFFSK